MSSFNNRNAKPLDPKFEKWFFIAIVSSFLIAGIVMLCLRYSDNLKYNELKEAGHYAYVTVEYINVSDPISSSKTYYMYGTYTVDEQNYSFKVSSSGKINEGTRLLLFYEEDNPSNHIVEGFYEGSYFGGLLFCALPTFLIVLMLNSKSKKFDEIDAYNRKNAALRRNQYVAQTGDVWHVDLTNDDKNEELYKNRQTTSNFNINNDSVKGNVGNTAFYKRKE